MSSRFNIRAEKRICCRIHKAMMRGRVMKSIPRTLLSALLLFGIAPGAQSQNAAPAVTPAPPQSTVHVITYIDVSVAAVPRAAGVLRQYRDAARAESGNTGVDLYQELGRASHFAVNEQWQDQASFDAHKRANAATQLLAALKEVQSAPPDNHIFQGYSVGPVRPPGQGNAKVYGMSHFEIPAARLADFGTLAKPFADMSRMDRGGMRFDILQESNPRQNQLTIFESWASPQDFEAHRISASVQKFRESLAPMLTGPYDDRFYGKFN